MEYPECEKMKKVEEDSQRIGEFLDWLLNETGIVLSEWDDINEELRGTDMSIEKVLAKYFNIDLVKVEKEKQHMLESMREANK